MRGTAAIQGVFYLLTALWALLRIDTFQQVTGPKTDLWLVKTVAALLVVISTTLLVAALRRKLGPELALLGIGTALAVLLIDVVYVALGVIRRVYLLDGAAEIAILAAWARRGRAVTAPG